MRVLHVHSGNLYGGVETTMLTLVRESGGKSSTIHEFALAFDDRIAAELRTSGVQVHKLGEVRARNPLSVFRARQRLAQLLVEQNFDSIICHMPWAHAIFASPIRRAARPLVFWMHGASNGRYWVERWAARKRPDLVICNSLFTASTLPHIFPQNAADILYCPVVIPSIPLSAEARLALRDELATPRDAIVIAQVGRMESLKGHSQLLNALAKLGDRNWVCWQVGGAQQPHEISYVESLKRLAVEFKIEDRVRFLGHRSDVARVLQSTDIYCQPNIAPDAFGISFIEALGARLPVVTTAMGGAIEIVDDSCGILVKPNDAAGLAGAIARLIDDPDARRALGAAGPARARELSDPAVIVRRLDTLLAKLN